MKELLAFGCSNTRGAEAINDYDEGMLVDDVNIQSAYPRHIADLLKCEYRNFAVNGISNQQIATKVFEVIAPLTDVKGKFVIIGWTDDDRLSIVKNPSINFRHAEKNDKLITISHSHVIAHTKAHLGQALTPAEIDHMKSVHDISFDFITGVAERVFSSKSYSDVNFFIKYATTCLLEEKGIPYLTFPTLFYHHNNLYNTFFSTNKHKNNILQHDRDGKIVFNYIKQFKSYGISKSGAHLKAEAHRQAGKYLYEYIINNNLLK
jgi:hypothetical protein